MSQTLRPFRTKWNRQDLHVLKELIEAGEVMPVMSRLPVPWAAEAMRYLEGGHARGKIVITMRGGPPGLEPVRLRLTFAGLRVEACPPWSRGCDRAGGRMSSSGLAGRCGRARSVQAPGGHHIFGGSDQRRLRRARTGSDQRDASYGDLGWLVW